MSLIIINIIFSLILSKKFILTLFSLFMLITLLKNLIIHTSF